jgi:cystathionine beta-synthase
MGRGKTVVVPLPDGGRAYISKLYSDEWMKDNGFLEPEGVRGAVVRDVLGDRLGRVHVARADETVGAVVSRLKENDVSQVPVVDGKGAPAGMVHEVDLLDFLLDGKHLAGEPVARVMKPLVGVVALDTPLARLTDGFAQGHVGVVVEKGRVVGIVSKIDVIDFLARRLS